VWWLAVIFCRKLEAWLLQNQANLIAPTTGMLKIAEGPKAGVVQMRD